MSPSSSLESSLSAPPQKSKRRAAWLPSILQNTAWRRRRTQDGSCANQLVPAVWFPKQKWTILAFHPCLSLPKGAKGPRKAARPKLGVLSVPTPRRSPGGSSMAWRGRFRGLGGWRKGVASGITKHRIDSSRPTGSRRQRPAAVFGQCLKRLTACFSTCFSFLLFLCRKERSATYKNYRVRQPLIVASPKGVEDPFLARDRG